MSREDAERDIHKASEIVKAAEAKVEWMKEQRQGMLRAYVEAYGKDGSAEMIDGTKVHKGKLPGSLRLTLPKAERTG